jgi:hypothetical protein
MYDKLKSLLQKSLDLDGQREALLSERARPRSPRRTGVR